MKYASRIGLLVVLAFLSGCSFLEPRSDGSRYFLLRSLATPAAEPALTTLTLGLGPVTVPEYLDRLEMIDLVDLYEVRYSVESRWIEPLGTQLRRTIGENLTILLDPDAVIYHPWYASDGVDLQVEIAFGVIRLDPGGQWVGSVEWVVRDPDTRAALERNDLSFSLGRDSIPPDEIAGALSAELQRLAIEIAGGVRRQYRSNQ